MPEPDRLWGAGRPRGACARPRQRRDGRKWTDAATTTRKPLLSFRLLFQFLLRASAEALSTLLFHEPPRTTFPGRLTREPRAELVYHKAPAREKSRPLGGFAPMALRFQI